MASSALNQLLNETAWQHQALDYLIVDMPPGTGDIQIDVGAKVYLLQVLLLLQRHKILH